MQFQKHADHQQSAILIGCAGTDKAVDKVTQPGLGDLLKNRGALIGTAMFLFQQLAGINAIIYFSSDVFAKVSHSHN